MKLEIEVPKEYKREIEELSKEIKLEKLFTQALVRCFEIELKKELLRRIAAKSKLTEEQALKLGEEVKEGIARRHRLT